MRRQQRPELKGGGGGDGDGDGDGGGDGDGDGDGDSDDDGMVSERWVDVPVEGECDALMSRLRVSVMR